MASTTKPKRIGWGSLLNSVKEKKEQKAKDTEATPTKKLKTTTPESKTKNATKDQKTTTTNKVTKPNTIAEKSAKLDQTTTKPTPQKPINSQQATKTEQKTENTKTNATKTPQPKTEKKDSTSQNKTNETNNTQQSKKRPSEEVATPNGDKKNNETKKTPSTHIEQEKEKAQPQAKKRKMADKMQEYKPIYDKEEIDRKQTDLEKLKDAKKELRRLLGKRKFYDFTEDGPLVVHVMHEAKPEDMEFCLNLLAKSYSGNYSDTPTYKNTKMVLGFDIEFLRSRPLTIQLSTAHLALVINLGGSQNRILAPAVKHLFSSADCIKCGVGVPLDMQALKQYYDISLDGMFDVSFFAVDMKLTRVPWSLEVLGMDLLDIGKVSQFQAKSAILLPEQIEYAARDAWIGYKLTDYFFGFFGTNFSSFHVWARAYSQKRQQFLEESSENAQLPKEEDEDEENEDEEDEDEESDDEENESEDSENEESENEDSENEESEKSGSENSEASEESEDSEEEKSKKGKKGKETTKKDTKKKIDTKKDAKKKIDTKKVNQKNDTKKEDKKKGKKEHDSISAAINKGVAIANKSATKQTMSSNKVSGIKHRIRNRLEGLKAARRKTEVEEELFSNLVEQMANKTGNKDDEDTENTGPLFNWV